MRSSRYSNYPANKLFRAHLFRYCRARGYDLIGEVGAFTVEGADPPIRDVTADFLKFITGEDEEEEEA